MAQMSTSAMRLLLQSHVATIAAGGILLSACAFLLLLCHYSVFLLGKALLPYALLPPVFLTSIGAGSLISHRIDRKKAINWFLAIECFFVFLACVGLPLLYTTMLSEPISLGLIITQCILMGLGTGLLLPLLDPIHKKQAQGFAFSVSHFPAVGIVFGLALALSVPLLPQIGFFRFGAILGLLNALLGIGVFYSYPRAFKKTYHIWFSCLVAGLIISTALVLFAGPLQAVLELTIFDIHS